MLNAVETSVRLRRVPSSRTKYTLSNSENALPRTLRHTPEGGNAEGPRLVVERIGIEGRCVGRRDGFFNVRDDLAVPS